MLGELGGYVQGAQAMILRVVEQPLGQCVVAQVDVDPLPWPALGDEALGLHFQFQILVHRGCQGQGEARFRSVGPGALRFWVGPAVALDGNGSAVAAEAKGAAQWIGRGPGEFEPADFPQPSVRTGQRMQPTRPAQPIDQLAPAQATGPVLQGGREQAKRGQPPE